MMKTLQAGMTLAVMLACSLQAYSARGNDEERTKYLTSFGKRYLAGIHVVAEVRVEKVSFLGRGVAVVRLKPVEIFLDYLTPRQREERPLIVISMMKDYVEGAGYLVFLAQYSSGRRYITKQCLSVKDSDYGAKLRLVREYISIEKIKDRRKRGGALKTLLLKNIGDASSWVRWNSCYELRMLVRNGTVLFTRRDADVVASNAKRKAAESDEEISSSYRESLTRIRDEILLKIDEQEKKQKEQEDQSHALSPFLRHGVLLRPLHAGALFSG